MTGMASGWQRHHPPARLPARPSQASLGGEICHVQAQMGACPIGHWPLVQQPSQPGRKKPDSWGPCPVSLAPSPLDFRSQPECQRFDFLQHPLPASSLVTPPTSSSQHLAFIYVGVRLFNLTSPIEALSPRGQGPLHVPCLSLASSTK